MGGVEAYTVFRGKTGSKEALGRPRLRWKDNIKVDLQEVGWGCMVGSSWFKIGTGGGHL
jgi:hypothetical protein